MTKKDWPKSLFQVNEKKARVFVLIANKKQMFAVKLQVNTAVVCIYYIILNLPSIFTFHISHTTWGI